MSQLRPSTFMLEQLHKRFSRKSGDFPYPCPTLTEGEARAIFGELLDLPRAYFSNEDGTRWEPQNPDGSLPYLPGYDGPIEDLD
jgi:hypothetical protein